MVYTVLLTAEADGGYSVSVPALPGCFTQGRNVRDALEMAKDAVKLYIDALRADGRPVPDGDHTLVATIEV